MLDCCFTLITSTHQLERNMTKAQIWIAAFDEAMALGFTALQAGMIADRTVRNAA
jgi:hypothetical protein